MKKDKNKQEAPHPLPLATPCLTPDSVCSAVLKVILCNEGNDTRAEFRELPCCLSKLQSRRRRGRMTGGRKGRTFYNVCSCRRARQRRRRRRQQHETMSPPRTPSYAAPSFPGLSEWLILLALFGYECAAVRAEERQTSPWDAFFSRFLLFLFPPFSLPPFFSSCLDRFRAGWDCDYEGRDGRVPPLSQRCSQEDRA